MGMRVRKGAKVSYNGLRSETIVGTVVGFGGSDGKSPLVMASGDFVRSWMHKGDSYFLYETVGGIKIELPVEGYFYYYVSVDGLKVLGYE